MSIRDIYIPMFEIKILSTISHNDQVKIIKSLKYHDSIRQSWLSNKKCDIDSDEIEIQYEASNVYIRSLCKKHKSEIRVKSFELLTDVVNWFHINKISFIIHNCHEYEFSSITQDQLDSLNLMVTSKYGDELFFVELI